MENGLLIRPLHLVERLTEELGAGIAYAYDDLVFIDGNDLLLRFDDCEADALYLYVGAEVHPEDAQKITDEWLQVALMLGVNLSCKGAFSVAQVPGTTDITVRFS